jgi:hypothetical protein
LPGRKNFQSDFIGSSAGLDLCPDRGFGILWNLIAIDLHCDFEHLKLYITSSLIPCLIGISRGRKRGGLAASSQW